jgi:transposase
MLQMMESHAASNFHLLWTGDESWMFYEHDHETMWVASWEEVDELERPTHYHRKTMITPFFNGTGECFLNMLSQNRSVDTNYFVGEIVSGLEDVRSPKRRNRHEKTITLHFDNAVTKNTRTVMGQLEQSGLNRMGRPPCSPDLAPCDFFLFGYMKEQLRGRSFTEEEEFLSMLSVLTSEILSQNDRASEGAGRGANISEI